MRLPISLALGWPDRVEAAAAPVDWTAGHRWDLQPLDDEAFPAVRLARQAGQAGHCRPAVYNAANEELLAAFVAGRLPFLGIVDLLQRVLDETPEFPEPGTVEEVLAAESWARVRARELVGATGAGKETT
jgi:1-deoxy-D-xylulose-5-phosphate reductoisomerase